MTHAPYYQPSDRSSLLRILLWLAMALVLGALAMGIE